MKSRGFFTNNTTQERAGRSGASISAYWPSMPTSISIDIEFLSNFTPPPATYVEQQHKELALVLVQRDLAEGTIGHQGISCTHKDEIRTGAECTVLPQLSTIVCA